MIQNTLETSVWTLDPKIEPRVDGSHDSYLIISNTCMCVRVCVCVGGIDSASGHNASLSVRFHFGATAN